MARNIIKKGKGAMGWRKELKKEFKRNKEFRAEIRNYMSSTDTTLKILLVKINDARVSEGNFTKLIEVLGSQNEQLFEKLMARNLPEYKTFTIPGPEGDFKPIDEYEILSDENLAGEVVDIPQDGS